MQNHHNSFKRSERNANGRCERERDVRSAIFHYIFFPNHPSSCASRYTIFYSSARNIRRRESREHQPRLINIHDRTFRLFAAKYAWKLYANRILTDCRSHSVPANSIKRRTRFAKTYLIVWYIFVYWVTMGGGRLGITHSSANSLRSRNIWIS